MFLTKKELKVYMLPIGGLYVTDQPMIIRTVLGSCISVTLFDGTLKIGGMNHIVLPGSFVGNGAYKMLDEKDPRYGVFSIEKLLYEMKSLGVKKENIEAKIYGASFMGTKNQSINIQSQNVDFVKAFLNMVNIDIKEEVVMQDEPLKISLDTSNGSTEVIKLKNEHQ